MEDVKICYVCKQTKPLSDFYRYKNYGKMIVSSYCRPCSIRRVALRRENNPGIRKVEHKKWYVKYRERERSRYAQNKDKILAKQRQYYIANRKARLVAVKAYILGHKEKYAEYQRGYGRTEAKRESRRKSYRRHREKYYAAVEQRRARKRQIPGSYSAEQWIALKERYGNRCLCCGKHEPEVVLTVDHVVPITHPESSGEIGNIQPLCKACNVRKGTKIIDYRIIK